jgi:hypothetical protein
MPAALAALAASEQQGSVFARARGFAPHRVSGRLGQEPVVDEMEALHRRAFEGREIAMDAQAFRALAGPRGHPKSR